MPLQPPVSRSAWPVPAFLLGCCPQFVALELLVKLRPDILIVHGLPASSAPPHASPALPPAALSLLQCDAVIHVVELGYTCIPTSLATYATRLVTLAAKQAQHAHLVTLLVSAGWRVFPESDSVLAVPHVIVLGTAATVFCFGRPCLPCVFPICCVPYMYIPSALLTRSCVLAVALNTFLPSVSFLRLRSPDPP
jgi:hypothetical protein